MKENIEDYIITTLNFRISFISRELFRIETQNYLDEKTQSVINRSLIESFLIDFEEKNDTYIFKTEKIEATISKNGIVKEIYLKETKTHVSDFYSYNLKGTARTLDGVNGGCKLSDGVCSKNGVAVLDDSKSLVLINDELFPRKECTDLYYFAYGNNYFAAIKALYHLTGSMPLIPKYALGNWWSRYHEYTEKEYDELILKFEDKRIPINVSVIDMDWHYVNNYAKFRDDSLFTKEELNDKKIQNDYYDGWTGYTWNKDLFPNYKRFLNFLHKHNLKVTLNLHPHSGVRKYEEAFNDMAKELNIDPNTINTIPFDIASKEFINAYLKVLHHPYEDAGVNFWWIDWQQGTNSKMKDLDPLWSLNHYHYIDNDRSNNRPLILSRYSGPGSHRYPLGFSGDTYISWEALNFQPYFTATATNIGYTWWSHDIGGHMNGIKDNELYLRWLQLGVFSPINRLHSTKNIFSGKEPWKYNLETERIATNYLRLRKKLIPYLYSINYKMAKYGDVLVTPLYYLYKEEEAYNFKNEFLFGSELLVSPITSKTNKITSLAGVKTYIPEGRFTDIFTNRIYHGRQITTLYREIDYIPVLAKEGAIIPTFVDDKTNNIDNNQDLEILVYRGNNTFTLYEDDGETKDYQIGKYSLRTLSINEENNTITFKITKNSNAYSDCLYKRNIIVSFKDVVKAHVSCNVDFKILRNKNNVCVSFNDTNEDVVFTLTNYKALTNKNTKEALIDLTSKFEMQNDIKNDLFLETIKTLKVKKGLAKHLSGPIKEILKLK